ncbi:MAG: ATP-binding protein [Promethearchaeota archaeon]
MPDPNSFPVCQSILDISNDAIIILDLKGDIMFMNDLAKKLTGWSAEKARGKRIEKILSIPLTKINALKKELLERQKITNFKMNIINFNLLGFGERQRIPINTNGVLINENNEDIVVLSLKIEDRGDSDMLWESLSQIWDFSKAASDIIQSIPSAMFICKIEKNDRILVLNANERACDLTHKSITEIQNEYFDVVWPKIKSESLEDAIFHVLQEEDSFMTEFSEFRNQSLLNAYKIRIFKIPRNRLGIIFEDITNLKKAEMILEEENIKLKEIDRMRRDFVMNATHELKTPLMTVGGASQFAIDNFDTMKSADLKKFLKHIQQGYYRLKDLIDKLLDFSRLDTGRLNLELKVEDLHAIIMDSVKSVGYLIKKREHEISLDIPDSLELLVDRFRIEQVLVNLLSNAIKNTPIGGMIKVKLERRGEKVVVKVMDNGIGLTSVEMEYLFQKFGKIDRKDALSDIDIQGSGLGLFISKEIVELHGGKIWAESDGRHKGSSFIFELPIQKE